MGSKLNSSNMQLEEIRGFMSSSEYDRFLIFIEGLLNEKVIKKIKTPDSYEKMNKETWIQVIETKENWRLIPPDFPFKGLFEPVR